MLDAAIPRARSAWTTAAATVVLPAPGVPASSTTTSSEGTPELRLHVAEHALEWPVRVDRADRRSRASLAARDRHRQGRLRSEDARVVIGLAVGGGQRID